jgi:hypothetical protein
METLLPSFDKILIAISMTVGETSTMENTFAIISQNFNCYMHDGVWDKYHGNTFAIIKQNFNCYIDDGGWDEYHGNKHLPITIEPSSTQHKFKTSFVTNAEIIMVIWCHKALGENFVVYVDSTL